MSESSTSTSWRRRYEASPRSRNSSTSISSRSISAAARIASDGVANDLRIVFSDGCMFGGAIAMAESKRATTGSVARTNRRAASTRLRSAFGAFLNPELPLRRLRESQWACSSRRFGGVINREARLRIRARSRGSSWDRRESVLRGLRSGASRPQAVGGVLREGSRVPAELGAAKA
jgi:hypothetical protein